jgi:hypothetical protein
MLTKTQLPYTGPYGLAASGLKSYGPTALALKRSMARLGLLPWEPDEWDQHFNKNLAGALAKWDPGATGYGPGRHEKLRAARIPADLEHAGEYAADATALQLIQTEHATATAPPDTALAKARAMLDYCRGFTGSYLWGGGHGVDADTLNRSMRLDCSSSTSLLLDHFDMLGTPDVVRTSDWFEGWGEPGRGRYVTVHANADHVWTEYTLPEGYFRFDTSPHGDGPRGPRVRTVRRFDSGFVHRHPAGL